MSAEGTNAPPIPLACPELGAEELQALAAVLASGRLSVGSQLTGFESEMAALAGCAGAAGVNSGTIGIQLALQALGVGAGDEVVTVSYTFVGSVNAIVHCGATPVLVDVDPVTLNMDPTALAAALGPRTRAVLVVQLFGRPADMDAILAVTRPRALPVIEDACEAIGARYRGAAVGGLASAGVFGFYPNKSVATGEGGMVVSNDAQLLARVRRLRNQGTDPLDGSWETDRAGYSARLSELHAALGRVQLHRLEDALRRRAAVAARYLQALAGDPRIELPAVEAAGDRIGWFTFPLRVRGIDAQQRDSLMARLHAAGIGCGPYFRPVHTLPYHRGRWPCMPLPVTESVGARCLGLPLFTAMRDDQVDRVCEVLQQLVRSLRT